QYLRRGRQLGVPERYKCRVRSPWYAVPHVYKADAFLTYMSGSESRLVANGTAAAAPNTLHIARLRRDASLTAEQLAAVWCSTLCRLSCEIEGHSLGGGLLKLEPGEAANVLVPLCEISPELVLQVDAAVRSGSLAQAADLIDPVVGAAIGHRPEELALLRESLAALRRRRTKR
ncbi:MAG: hypothetical protein ACRD1T_18820, partial [Acidimicrobiia bacterium]